MIKTVRDGQKVWPYCANCGCRLDLAALYSEGMPQRFVGHFRGNEAEDGRGHRCKDLLLYKIIALDDLTEFIGV